MDRPQFVIAWYTNADPENGSKINQDGIKKLLTNNEDLFFRILYVHIAQAKDRSVDASNAYIKICLDRIVGQTESSSSSSVGQKTGGPTTLTPKPRPPPPQGRNPYQGAHYRGGPRGFSGFSSGGPPPVDYIPPVQATQQTGITPSLAGAQVPQHLDDEQPMSIVDEDAEAFARRHTGEGPQEDMELGSSATSMAPMYNFHPRQPSQHSDDADSRWEGAVSEVNRALEQRHAGVHMLPVDRQEPGLMREIDALHLSPPAVGEKQVGVEIGALPHNQATFNVDQTQLENNGNTLEGRLDYVPPAPPIGSTTVVINRDEQPRAEIPPIPELDGNRPLSPHAPLAAVDRLITGGVDAPDTLEEFMESLERAIARTPAPLPPLSDDDIILTSTLWDEATLPPWEDENNTEETVRIEIDPAQGESDQAAVDRIVRPILADLNQTPPGAAKIRFDLHLRRQRERLKKWRETHPFHSPSTPSPFGNEEFFQYLDEMSAENPWLNQILTEDPFLNPPQADVDIEPGSELRQIAFPQSGRLSLNVHPPNPGEGTSDQPYNIPASQILDENRVDGLERGHLVFQPRVNLSALPGSFTEPRNIVYSIPAPESGHHLVRAPLLPDSDEPDSHDPAQVTIFRKPAIPPQERDVELVFDDDEELTGEPPAPIRPSAVARFNEKRARKDLLLERRHFNRALVQRRLNKYNQGGYFDPRLRRDLLLSHLSQRKRNPASAALSARRAAHPDLFQPGSTQQQSLPLTRREAQAQQRRVNALRRTIAQRRRYPVNELLREVREENEEDERLRRQIQQHGLPRNMPGEQRLPNAIRALAERHIVNPEDHSPDIPDDVFATTQRQLEAHYRNASEARLLAQNTRNERLEEHNRNVQDLRLPQSSTFKRVGKGVAIKHAAGLIFATMFNPRTSDRKFSINAKMLNQLVKHWPPQPYHDTITDWKQIFGQNPRGQTKTVDPYERQMKISSLFKLVHGDKNKLYPYVDPSEAKGAGAKYHLRSQHIISPHPSMRHYRDRRTLGKKRLNILSDACFYKPTLTFGGNFLSRVS